MEAYIDVDQYCIYIVEKWFKEEYEDVLLYKELYEQDNLESPYSYVVRNKYNDIFWNKVQEIKDELLEYEIIKK